MSMPISTQTSSSASSIHHRLRDHENIKKFRDVSFSSYLDASEETFVLQLGCIKATPDNNLNSSISAPHHHIPLEKNKKHENTKIEVFDARKYFNDGLNQTSRLTCKTQPGLPHLKNQEIFEIRDRPRVGSPSIRSVSSSNSRSALLRKPPRNQLQPKQTNKKNILSSIRCNCYCNDTNSVDIDDYTGETRSTDKEDHRTGHHLTKPEPVYNYVKFDEPELRSGHFSFPVFNPRTGNPEKIQVNNPDRIRVHKPVHVFGSPVQENGSGLEKKLSMLTWDAIAPASGGSAAEEIKIPPTSYEDSDSDASSDLFEIESLSKGNSFLSRQASDGLSDCITPRNCYAPSEASVEWSVVTASVADFSVLSDSEELRPNFGNTQKKKERLSSIISGCKSKKAVRVAGDAYRRNYEEKGFAKGNRRLVRSESFTRFRDGKIGAVERQQFFDARILPQSNSGAAAAAQFLRV